jgi:hypothetical protein
LRLEHEEPDAVRAGHHLADHHQDQGQREAGPHAGEDLRGGGGKRGEAGQSVDAGGVVQRRVDAADAIDRVEQDRPEADEGDDCDLHRIADADHHDRQREQRRRRDRA